MGFRICILGSGSIGTYYGAKLAHGGSDVHFLMRGDLTEVRREGIFVRGEGENFHVPKINCYNNTKEIGPCDLVIIAVKATSNSAIVDLIPPLLHEKTMLLTLQNGLGGEDLLAAQFGAERVLGGLCLIAVDRHSKSKVERHAYGEVILGEFGRESQPRTYEVANEFTRGGVKCRVTDNLARERWRKLIWNIPFNGLSIVAGGIDTAAILADKHFRELTLALMNEVINAANKLGFMLEPDAWRKHIERTEGMSTGYKPSTLQDWETGKPLEIEAIWGEPVRRARAAGTEMPRTETIYELLKQMDRLRRAMRAATPKISVRNLQRKVPVDLVQLESFAARVMKLCLPLRGGKRSELRRLTEILVLIVSDRKIAALHRQFMKIPGPTDVITFQHGEIFISVDTARKNARRFGSSCARELSLYLVHGLLHLHGFDDRNERGRRKMETTQGKILAKARLSSDYAL